ncbi:MAG: hypothetical protein A2275_00265 [Bacteroidetes bacterium RIFOXYA12_FULL_35_11]|nr:MAG: hypothetical protein A2X01_20580 [Bacteroidetes bacterium GWF2_35_48]OFY83578.1 MAG: hypothetical protein A2275_00265 [Bacteroidetes bacterium RIFOXYA12_FULL_35_11]OFY95872.1 MAG: hypothetical protein A2491_09890 [Bacteroidetes bacterium RIFOXYC12_FULL_35_7]HBX51760.1 acyltransferase [Bacteroidales bacterium]
MLLKLLGRAVLKLTKWKTPVWPEGISKCICIEAPHTSMWDFFWGKAYFASIGMKTYFLIKKEAFYFPFDAALKALGGLPVDRKNTSFLVEKLTDMLKKKKEFSLVITPEGTRNATKRWKYGFFHIAQKTKLPLVVSYIDYKKKELGIFGVIHLKEDDKPEEVMAQIKKMYTGITAKYPENFTCEV